MNEYNDTVYEEKKLQEFLSKVDQLRSEKHLPPLAAAKFIRTGIGTNEQGAPVSGIYITPELEEYTKLNGSQKELAQIAAFEQLSTPFRTVLKSNQTTQAYLASTEVSIAYHPTARPHYQASAIVLAAKNANTNKNIDLVVGGDLNIILINLDNPETINKLKKNGYNNIEFINLDDQSKNRVLGKPNSSGKKFRIIYQQRLEHSNMIKLTQLSTIVGATGDQSLSETLSGDCIPIYSALNHKEDLLKKLIIQYNKNFPEVALIVVQLSNLNKDQFRGNREAEYLDLLEKLGKELADPRIQEQVRLANRELREYWNLEHSLTAVCDQILPQFCKTNANQSVVDRVSECIDHLKRQAEMKQALKNTSSPETTLPDPGLPKR